MSAPNLPFVRLKDAHVAGRLNSHTRSSGESTADVLKRLLDETQDKLNKASSGGVGGATYYAMDRLFKTLSRLRRHSTPEAWLDLVASGRAHPVCRSIHEDPFTSRAFRKPRGYAGDAVMMDYIYSREDERNTPPCSDLGREIFDYTTGAPASRGVRERRRFMAGFLDRFAPTCNDAEVLAVAAGHLREAGLSQAVRDRRFKRFAALDADRESLKEISRCYNAYGIEPVSADVRRMLTGRIGLGKFDLIYTTGLYDYLAAGTAARLTANLFACLKPGGKVVIANFLPDVRDIGYMEMFMDWFLIYRSRGEMVTLAERIEPSSIHEIRIVGEPNENVVILELTRRP